MSALEDQPCVGLFGTCGKSTFRKDLFIPAYEELGITYFNPQVDDWNPAFAAVEADHLAYDVVQCWPVLGITYGTGSLAESGFSIAASMDASTPLPKFVIPFVEMELDESLDDAVARKESERARALVKAHLAKNPSPNVFVVSSLEEMLETSIALYGAAQNLVELCRVKTPAFKRFMDARAEQLAFRDAMERGLLGADAKDLAQRS